MITLLTHQSTALKYKIKNFKRRLFNQAPCKRGHEAVKRSIIQGLTIIGCEYNIDVTSSRLIGEHLHVLSGFEALSYGIKLKRKGKVKYLTVGPNVAISSADYGGLISSPYIDKVLVPSKWMLDAFIEDNKELNGRIDTWYSGVDPFYWDCVKEKPMNSDKLTCLLYFKYPQKKIVDSTIYLLNEMKIDYFVVTYGNYEIFELKDILSKVDFAIVFSASETQGLALFEIWATNTPTFVWDVGNYQYKLKNYEASSAPYLSSRTGCFFRNIDDLSKLLKNFNLLDYDSRNWILESGTDEISATNFIQKIKVN